jgi:two-component system OmpR family sensor kinase
MSAPPQRGSAGHWRAVKKLPDHVPMRIKLITALLALVVIALAVISVSSLVVFRNYLEDRADAQLRGLVVQAENNPGVGGPSSPAFSLAGYVIELRDAHGQPITNWGTWQQLQIPGPEVPAGRSWLSANAGKLVTVPAASGQDTWRVIAKPFKYHLLNPFTGQSGPDQTGTLIVGVDLGGNINAAVGTLARVDLIVSVIVIAGLFIVGVAIVRASMRPLKDIEATAAAIAAGDLSRRVPEGDPRTEVGRLGRALNTMLTQIESAFHARERSEAAARRSQERMRQFVADASHELRTPLTAIRGYAEYYRQRGGLKRGSYTGEPEAAEEQEPSRQPVHSGAAPDTAQRRSAAPGSPAAPDSPGSPGSPGSPASSGPSGRDGGEGPGTAGMVGGSGHLTRRDMDRIMERVEQESSRMGGLVEDMLVLARVDEQRPVERRPVDLLTLAVDAVQDARMVAPDRKIDLTLGSGAAFLVLGDEPRLRQVISNLMSNALTHTPAGTPVNVRIRAGYQGVSPAVPAAILEVADQGRGLTQEQAERVFERFYRADQARGRHTGGTGLGLAIVAALVAAHGGTVGVNTAPGQGATFWITLPLAPEATAP